MQTFLPYKDFRKSLQCLDYRRLGKQRVEAMQIYNTLTGRGKGWESHPIVKMWKGYEEALAEYQNIAIEEWIGRGYNNTMKIIPVSNNIKYPNWIGNREFHKSHKSNLLRKYPEFYGKYRWKVSDDLPYVWIK